jgi:hypothetical protein
LRRSLSPLSSLCKWVRLLLTGNSGWSLFYFLPWVGLLSRLILEPVIDSYFLQVLAVAVFWVWGFNYAFKPGEILGKPGDWMRDHWPKALTTPLFDCPYCMSSIHGTGFYFVFLLEYPLYFWPILVVSITGVGALVRPN